SVYDAVGNKVSTIFNEVLRAGESIQRPWSANDFYGNELNSGVYFLKLEGNNVNKVQKVIINR
ncbi:MAG: T9SS type A sorting domain-containing protein, partial [Candidatus Kapaibacterium sp.]